MGEYCQIRQHGSAMKRAGTTRCKSNEIMPLTGAACGADESSWSYRGAAYIERTRDQNGESFVLRELGLKPTLQQMLGDCSAKRVLDIGCADGWLLDVLNPKEGVGCDIRHFDGFRCCWNFVMGDARGLPFPSRIADVTISSLVLMWFPEYKEAIQEMARVCEVDGVVVIAIMQPYFYRTGDVDEYDNFVVSRNLSRPFVLEELRIAGEVGPFAYHYRPMPDYLNACIRAGLRIEEVRDWHLDLGDYVRRFGSAMRGSIRRTGKVPMYSFIKCRKD